MKKKIIILTQWFDPEPAYRGADFAASLVAAGYDVEVVTGFPNYPGGRVYSGFKLRPIKKTMSQEGYGLTRLFLYPSHNHSKLGRIANYLSFFFSALIYLCVMPRKVDLVYVYHPPLTVGLAAAVAKFFRRWPIVLDIQDLWPDTLQATGMISNKRVLGIVARAANWLYGRTDHIVVQSWGFRHRLLKRGVEDAKVSVVINWSKGTPTIGVSLPNPFPDPKKFRILFSGNMGRAQALDSVLLTAQKISKDTPDVGFYFLGDGLEKKTLQAQASQLELSNVTFLVRVSAINVIPYLVHADALLVHLSKNPLFDITIPSKTQEYFRIGKPILMGVSGDAARLVNEAKAGIVFPPEDPDAMVKAIKRLISMPQKDRLEIGRSAKIYSANQLSEKNGMAHFTGIFEDLISKRQVNPDRGWKN